MLAKCKLPFYGSSEELLKDNKDNLTSTKPKERNEVMAIKKQIDNFDFVCMLVMQYKILQIANIPWKVMQCNTIDLISAHKLLQTAPEDIAQLRKSFDAVVNKASLLLLHAICQNSF